MLGWRRGFCKVTFRKPMCHISYAICAGRQDIVHNKGEKITAKTSCTFIRLFDPADQIINFFDKLCV